MFKNKRTRVLLYVLGGVLAVAIGVLIWGAASGRISALADVVVLPNTRVFNITGQVTNKDGEAFGLPRGSITLNRYDSLTKKYSVVGMTSMDENGNYGFTNIPANSFYRLEAYEATCHRTLIGSSLSGKANETKIFNLAMTKFPSIKGRITYKDGTPLESLGMSGMTISDVRFVVKEGDKNFNAILPEIIDTNGNYEVSCLDPAKTIYAEKLGAPVPLPIETAYTIIKTYSPISWAGAVLNIALPYNKSDIHLR